MVVPHILMADYNPDQYLWEKDFTLAGRKYKRQDLEATKESKRPHLAVQSLCAFTFPGGHSSTLCYILPWKQKDDLKVVVSYLRSNEQISCIGLWGRSMGAVTSLLYGAEDPSIAGMVLDSAFSNLFDLMMELVDVYKIRLPKFTVWVSF
ncbi:hypothetical protein CsSME_00031260 [Camellia sinensis var. sinensis]